MCFAQQTAANSYDKISIAEELRRFKLEYIWIEILFDISEM